VNATDDVSPGPAPFSRVTRMPRLSDTVAEEMLHAIVTGSFREGDILPSERELSEQFGVSRTVIREAVRTLATRGVVEVQSGRGVLVIPPHPDRVTEAVSLLLRVDGVLDFTKVHEVRTMLETYFAGVAAERGTEDDHRELEQMLDAWEKATGDVVTSSRLDVDFHRAIAKAGRNELFLVLLDSIAGVLLENRRATLALEHHHVKVYAEHRDIVTAIKARDPESARRAMAVHLNGVAETWHSQHGQTAALPGGPALQPAASGTGKRTRRAPERAG
jgi:GntR family transcriptional regulator, transcriptional repressor for pyruvate dehydrogenase complex